MDFDIAWINKEKFDKEASKFDGKINLMHSYCVPFSLACHEKNGMWGMWIFLNRTWLQICPIALVSSLYEDSEYCIYLTDGAIEYEVSITKSDCAFVWRVICVEKSYYEIFHFSLIHYFQQIQYCVRTLYKKMHEGFGIIYKLVNLNHLELCCKQLDIDALHPSLYNVKASNIMPEKFVFIPSRNKINDEYKIGIGDRTFDTFLTHWDSNYEKITHQLESLVYNDKTSIELNFDASDTIIHIHRVSVIDTIETTECGYRYKYKEYALVKIIPNDFLWYPTIVGYCDYKATLRTLYEGLLRFAVKQSYEVQDSNNVSLRIEMYNSFKSPLLENYITKNRAERPSFIKHILKIMPDYNSIGIDLATNFDVGIDSSGELDDDFLNKHGEKIVMPELARWQQEVRPIIIASECGESYKKDWMEFHKRGIELVRELRKQLSDDCDVWYAPPFEDKSGIVKGCYLIM